jgi:hypothetical protein
LVSPRHRGDYNSNSNTGGGNEGFYSITIVAIAFDRAKDGGHHPIDAIAIEIDRAGGLNDVALSPVSVALVFPVDVMVTVAVTVAVTVKPIGGRTNAESGGMQRNAGGCGGLWERR